MTKNLPFLLAAVAISLAAVGARAVHAQATPGAAAAAAVPSYDGDRLRFPADYRRWIYLTTGFDMSYTFSLERVGHHMFDNVFVDPEAWEAFQKTGTWPDRTILLIEGRGAKDKASINQAGHFQDTDVMGWEVHVKDEARTPGRWTFYSFEDPAVPARPIATSNDCYSCHQQHAAVDNTFVQFYPTLLPLATAKGTLAPAYLAEENAKKAAR